MPGGSAGRKTSGALCGASGHVPVLLTSVLEALAPSGGELILDGTFGAGGYARAILEAADCRLIALDRDPDAVARAQAFYERYGDRFTFIAGRFGALDDLMQQAGVEGLDAVVLDVGVSSMQLDDPARGFSFAHDGPLDMRMSQAGLSAADVVNGYDEKDLARIIAALGEERRARAIARAIVRARDKKPFVTTLELADLIAGVLGRKPGAARHPATRTFQALRIYVNRELEELAFGLAAAERLLKPGGRLVVVSFHSLEDRIVKQFLTKRTTPRARPSRHLPDEDVEVFAPSFRLMQRKTITPDEAELAANPRARSSRLRAAIRLDAPAFAFSLDELKIPTLPEGPRAGD